MLYLELYIISYSCEQEWQRRINQMVTIRHERLDSSWEVDTLSSGDKKVLMNKRNVQLTWHSFKILQYTNLNLESKK